MTISVRVKGDRPDRMGIPGPAAEAMRRYLAVREDCEDCSSGALFVRKGQRIQRSYIRTILRRTCRRRTSRTSPCTGFAIPAPR
jgi:site-specific recombinase XerC